MPPHTLPMCLYKEVLSPSLLSHSPHPKLPQGCPNGSSPPSPPLFLFLAEWKTSWSSFMPPLVADFSPSMPQQLEDFLELSSISKWRKMRRVLGVPWRSPSYLHLVSIEGLQSFKKMALLLARRRATFLSSWRSSSMAPRKDSWKEKKRRRWRASSMGS